MSTYTIEQCQAEIEKHRQEANLWQLRLNGLMISAAIEQAPESPTPTQKTEIEKISLCGMGYLLAMKRNGIGQGWLINGAIKHLQQNPTA